MILSMTGFGRMSRSIGHKSLTIEIRALNSRYFDLNLRLPSELRIVEPTIRSMVSKELIRGKIDVAMNLEGEGIQTHRIDKELIKKYYNDLKELGDELGTDSDFIASILRIPDVIVPSEEEPDKEEQQIILAALEESLGQVTEFRKQEGTATEKDMAIRVDNILILLKEIENFDEERKAQMRSRLEGLANEYLSETKADQNRLEEELVYYLEKMDITEEKVRLANHCHYLKELIEDPEYDKGKRLNFICQEIGREINTIGSKASYAPIQRIVVQMKDDLEKMKEQAMNIL